MFGCNCFHRLKLVVAFLALVPGCGPGEMSRTTVNPPPVTASTVEPSTVEPSTVDAGLQSIPAIANGVDPVLKQHSVERLLELAKAGNANAMVALGDRCKADRSKEFTRTGKETIDEIKMELLRRRKLLDESCYWYEQAAKLGNVEAQCKLAGAARVRKLMKELDQQDAELDARLHRGYSPVEMHLRASSEVYLDAMAVEGGKYQENAFQVKAHGP